MRFIDDIDELLRSKDSVAADLLTKRARAVRIRRCGFYVCQLESTATLICALQIHDKYTRPGNKISLVLPTPLQANALSALSGTPDYEALLRLAKTEMLFVLANGAYARFCSSPAYAALLTELSEISASRDVGQEGVSEFSGLPLPPPPPGSWLERFTLIADLLPICVTISDVSLR